MENYSSEARALQQELEAAVQAQKEAMTRLAAAVSLPGEPPDCASVLESIEFHDKRVMDLRAKLQPFRLDK